MWWDAVASDLQRHESIADVAGRLLNSRLEAMVLVDAEHRARGVLTSEAILTWVAAGAGNAQQSVETLLHHAPGDDRSRCLGRRWPAEDGGCRRRRGCDHRRGDAERARAGAGDEPRPGAAVRPQPYGAAARSSRRGEHARTSRSEPAGARLRSGASHGRIVGRLAGTLHPPCRFGNPHPRRRHRRS